ncbi:transcriptional regulator PadR-like family protein [Halorhabdus tiamatea SARL4B]|uniref:Transcriptional regulator PadR-like family protein n=2 Tax=Halorhabdus tiamatea SARL4B TaxID=1033806 RepID=U2F7Z9_9EURY|nr:transcriptional regulator PadR-like family protein [Halorhabdus tiamatea SARL4B]
MAKYGTSGYTKRYIYIYSIINFVRTLPMYDLTGFQRDLLYVIAGEEEPHGLAIKEELEDYYEKEIHHGRLYPNLDTLVDKGLVEKGQRDRRTNYYSLTRRGRREIEARRDWESQYVDL